MFSDFNKEKFLLIGNLTPHLIHDIRNSLSVLKLNYYYLNLKEESIPNEIASSLKGLFGSNKPAGEKTGLFFIAYNK